MVYLVWLIISALMFGVDIPAASAENRTPHGIDLKNPFTMSKTRTPSQRLRLPLLEAADLMILITGFRWSALPPAAPSVAAKPRLKAAPCSAGRPGLRAN